MKQDATRRNKTETGSVLMHKMNKRDKNIENYIYDKQDEGYELDKQDHKKKSLLNKGEQFYLEN